MATKFSDASPGRPAVTGCGRPSAAQLSWAIAFGVSLGVGIAVLRHLTVPPAARYLLPAVPLAIGFFYLRAMVRDMRRQMDELQLRIYLEAAAVAVGGLFIFLLIYPMLEAAGFVAGLDPFVVLAVMCGLGVTGYLAARRRYR